MQTEFLSINLEGRNHLEDLGLDRKVITEMDLR